MLPFHPITADAPAVTGLQPQLTAPLTYSVHDDATGAQAVLALLVQQALDRQRREVDVTARAAKQAQRALVARNPHD